MIDERETLRAFVSRDMSATFYVLWASGLLCGVALAGLSSGDFLLAASCGGLGALGCAIETFDYKKKRKAALMDCGE